MASSKDRQRKLARAKYERQMARKAAAVRRRRQIQAGVGTGLAVLLIAVGGFWLFGGFDSKSENAAGQDICAWTPQQGDNLKDVGLPPAKDIPTDGTRPMTITTDSGVIGAEVDVTTSPCAAASLAHLATKNFYDSTKCHEITTEGALRCGDPSGSGLGGPRYSYHGENVPSAPEPTPTPSAKPAKGAKAPKMPPTYPRGTVALVGNAPGNMGSQFLIFFKDFTVAEPAYSILGRVTTGLDVLDKIVKAGTKDNGSGAKVKPVKDVMIQSLTVGEVAPAGGPGPTPTGPAPTPPATKPATASPSASAQS